MISLFDVICKKIECYFIDNIKGGLRKMGIEL